VDGGILRSLGDKKMRERTEMATRFRSINEESRLHSMFSYKPLIGSRRISW